MQRRDRKTTLSPTEDHLPINPSKSGGVRISYSSLFGIAQMAMMPPHPFASAKFAERREFDRGLKKGHFDENLSMTTDQQPPLAASSYSEFSCKSIQ